MNAPEIERWLHARLAAELGVEPADLDATEPLTRYGLDSATAMQISGELGEILSRAVDPSLVFDHPDIRSLAASLAREEREDYRRPTARLDAPRPREPLAIVGLACRFPGAPSPERFWALMLDGTDPIQAAPEGRWDATQVAAAAQQRGRPIPGSLGGFLDHVELFDPLFFGMPPREAARVDPQHRLLLELAWEAFEDAGIVPERIAGTRAGVFVGISSHEYGYRFLDDLADIDARTATGNAPSLAANRISYTFDLAGPSTAVDTACSSSLVAVHLACRSLWSGESSLVVAGGVNLILSPSVSFSLDAAGVLSPTGHCRPFADEADGYVRSEGAGLLILKRLSDAVSGGDRIYAVILGGAVNHDGRSSGLMAPRGYAQEDLLRAACADAGVEPSSVRFVEAHGTGTLLGDVIEARSIGAVLGGPDRREPCHVGSVKSNIGHLEAAAGIAGMIKAALALWHGILPPTRHVRSPNRHVDFAELGLSIADSPVPLQTTGCQAIGGVSSFGFGGTNAHVLLQGRDPAAPLPRPGTEDRRAQVLPLSAMTRDSLEQLVEAVANRLETVGDPADVAFSAAVRRSHHPWRLAVTGDDGPALAGRLRRTPLPDRPVPREPPFTVFVLPGQASRWHVRVPALADRFPAFQAAFDECADVLSERLGRPLAEFPSLGGHHGADAATAQSALFALQVALARTWMALGIQPASVVGHSAGEVAAAHLCGALSLEQAADVIVARGRAIEGAAGTGRMVFAELTAADASALIGQVAAGIEVAAINSEQSVVLSGPVAEFDPVLAELAARGIYHRPLDAVNYASHSAAMDGPSSRLGESLAGLKPADTAVPFVSTVTGVQVPGAELDGRYWARNLRERVAFSDAIAGLLDSGYRAFLEIGPQRSLVGSIAEEAGRRQAPVVTVASFAPDGPPDAGLLAGVTALYTAGHRLRWEALFPRGGRHVDVPGHPWRRVRCWVAPRPRAAPVAGPGPADKEMLDPLLYEVEWSPSAQRAGRADALEPPGSWLVVTAARNSGGDVADHVAAELASRGHRALIVDAEAPGGGPASLALRGQPSTAWRGILHLGALGVGRIEDDADLQRAQRVTLRVVGEIVAAQRAAGSRHRMWFITRGCQAADGNVAAPTGALLWGFGRSARAEAPDLVAGLIDLDPGATAAALAAQLCDAVLRPGQEPEIAIRGPAILAPRLVRKQAAPAALRCSPDATYLVTGGRGALGVYVAGELAARGARHLVLMGRSPLPPRREWNADGPTIARLSAAVRAIERLGGSVSLPTVDVADRADLTDYLTCFAQEGRPPIRGVVHAAGVARLTSITGDESAMLDVLRPKVLGGWLLHAAFADVPLDFFTCFSSMAVYFPLPLVGPYAAANAFLDALAYHRAGQGLSATSINWGAWAGSRMADSGDRELLRGTAELEPTEALAAFSALTAGGVTNAAVAHVDWDAFAAAYPTTARTPIARHLPSSAARDSRTSGEHEVLAELALAAPSARSGVLRTYVMSCLARALGMEPDDIPADRPLGEYGIDSIMAVELRNQFQAALGVTVEISALLQSATVSGLAEALAADVNERVNEDDITGLVAFVRDLSDDDVERLLSKRTENEPGR